MGCTEKYAADKKLYDMFQAIRALSVQKILKIRILRCKFLQNESFFSFSLKCFDFDCTPRKDTTMCITWHHSYSSKHCILKKVACVLLNSEIMRLCNLWKMTIEIGIL